MLARKILAGLDCEPGTAREICQALEAGESQAYEMLGRLEAYLPKLHQPPGRPSALAADPADTHAVATATVDFLMDNPGAVEGRGKRRRYHPAFRLFVLSLLEEGQPGCRMKLEEFATAVRVRLGTLKDWLKDPDPAASSGTVDGAEALSEEDLPTLEVHVPGIMTILREYPRWKGTFTAFCDHLRSDHDLPYRRTYIGTVLHLAGLRSRKPRRKPRSPWDRGTFEKMFPGAQWVGDGKQVVVEYCGGTFAFNLEAIVDPAASALVGFRITDVEDEAAVLAAYAEAKETTGEPPLGLTLDNRPSNHTEGVEEAVVEQDGARLLRSTPGRGQSKAPMEGAFGLFSQEMPELVVAGETLREQARSTLQIAATAYARGRNGRPRSKLGGQTPADAYRNARPTPEQVEAAKQHLAEFDRIQEERRRTSEAKADPVRRQLLVEKLAEFDISDPKGQLATELACYSLKAILRGLAIFWAKRRLDTLPHGADPGRYLGGIIRNVNDELEDELFSEGLLELHLRAGKLSLRHLEREADEIREERSPNELPSLLLTRALEAEALLDFRFWARELREALGGLESPRIRRASYSWLVGRIRKSYQTRRQRRQTLMAILSEVVDATRIA